MVMDLLRSAESPFTNYLVLKEIEKYLSEKDLKKARLVNHLWYLIFSEKYILKIENEQDYKKFMLIHHTENGLGTPYKKFHFGKWPRFDKTNWFPTLLFFQLSEVANIRQLILTNSKYPYSLSHLNKILRVISSTLEYLKIDLSFTYSQESPAPGSKVQTEFEIEFILPNFNHLYLIGPNYNCKTKLTKNKIEIFLNFFKNSTSFSEITVENPNIIPNPIVISSILDTLMIQKSRNLKKLTFLQENLCINAQNDVNKMIQFSEEFKNIEIDYFGNKFPSSLATDFFQIYALYEVRFSSFKKDEDIYKNLQLESVKNFSNYLLFDRFSSPFEKCLFHFPKLQKITLHDYHRLTDTGVKLFNGKNNQNFEELEDLHLKTHKLDNYSDGIKNFTSFPNLTKLNLYVDSTSEFQIEPLFQNLNKLRDLTLYIVNMDINDVHLTGFSKEFIRHRVGKPFKQLMDQTRPKRYPLGITALKNLEKFSLTVGYNAPTEISLFFAFRYLPRLKHLEINCTKTKRHNFLIGRTWRNEYWNIFQTEFKELEKLKVYSGHGNTESIGADGDFYEDKVFKEFYNHVMAQRPQLEIQFFTTYPWVQPQLLFN